MRLGVFRLTNAFSLRIFRIGAISLLAAVFAANSAAAEVFFWLRGDPNTTTPNFGLFTQSQYSLTPLVAPSSPFSIAVGDHVNTYLTFPSSITVPPGFGGTSFYIILGDFSGSQIAVYDNLSFQFLNQGAPIDGPTDPINIIAVNSSLVYGFSTAGITDSFSFDSLIVNSTISMLRDSVGPLSSVEVLRREVPTLVVSANVEPVPEPSTALLLMSGIGTLAILCRKRVSR